MLKVLSLFSGIGAFEKALENLEVPFELVNFCEFDKYAVKSCGRMDDNFVIDIESDEKTFKFDSTNSLIQVGQIYGTEHEPNPQAGRVYSAEGISPTMDTCSGGNRMPKVLVINE